MYCWRSAPAPENWLIGAVECRSRTRAEVAEDRHVCAVPIPASDLGLRHDAVVPKGCPTCGPHHFHRLRCPELETQVWIAAATLGLGLAVLTAMWASGGEAPRFLLLGVALTTALIGTAFYLRWYRRGRKP